MNNMNFTTLLTTLLNVINEAKNNKPLTTDLNLLLTENKVFQTLMGEWASSSLTAHLTKDSHLTNPVSRAKKLRFVYAGSRDATTCIECSKWISKGEQCFYFQGTKQNFHVGCATPADLTHPDYVLYYKPKTSPTNLLPCTDPLPQILDDNEPGNNDI